MITDSSKFDVEELLSQLTLDEKVELISGIDFWHTAKIERLGIPSLRVSDGPNGIRGTRFFNGVRSGCFPCGTALASTWDKKLLFEAGQLMAQEAKAKLAQVILGPTLNIQRSPLGGRGFESYSPDPVLSGYSASAIVNGIQDGKVAATLKHYVCNDMEDERNNVSSVVTERALREIYLLPFQLAVRDADPKLIMSSYNKVNGVHVSQSRKLLYDVLREEWGWDGLVMSDWFGCFDLKESIEAGLSLEMPGMPKVRHYDSVIHEVASKTLHIKDLNERVSEVLSLVKFTLDSGISLDAEEGTSNNTAETSLKLREIAAESVVLLKNDNDVLPLKKSDKIAIMGPNAKYSAYCGGGSASLLSYYNTTPFEGISERTKVDYTLGCKLYRMLPGLGTQLHRPDGSTGYSIKVYTDEAKKTLVDSLELDQSYMHMVDYNNPKVLENDKVCFMDFVGYYTPEEDGVYEFGCSCVGTALIYVDGKLVVDNKTKQTFGNTFFNLGSVEERGQIELKLGQEYEVKVEFGCGSTSSLTKGLPKDAFGVGSLQFGVTKVTDDEEEIAKAVAMAKANDKVVIFTGTSQEYESELFDRSDMKLPGKQDLLVSEVFKLNPNTIVVNYSGTPCEFPWAEEVPLILQLWFGGNELGPAIADVLFGDVNPSAKLSITFPIKLEDNPTFFNFKADNGVCLYGENVFVDYRFYEKIGKPVLFPFGHGISYTTFKYDNLDIKLDGDDLIVNFDVTNTGKVAGKEVAQLYIAPQSPSITRPVKELKNFTKLELQPGETKKFEIKTQIKYLTSFYDEYNDDWCSELGKYNVVIGKSAENLQLVDTFELKKTTHWKGL